MKQFGLKLLVGSCALLFVTSALAQDWVQYKADKYGFSMLVPKGTKVAGKDLGGGWGAMVAVNPPSQLMGLAQLGVQSKAAAIEAFGVKLTGIPAKHWKLAEQGKNKNGWKWYKAAVATDGKTMVVAVYGNGAKGSYLLLLKTTVADYAANKAAYEKWGDSLRLF